MLDKARRILFKEYIGMHRSADANSQRRMWKSGRFGETSVPRRLQLPKEWRRRIAIAEVGKVIYS